MKKKQFCYLTFFVKELTYFFTVNEQSTDLSIQYKSTLFSLNFNLFFLLFFKLNLVFSNSFVN